MKLNEEKILNYLDGLLDREEEKAFMEAIQQDEEMHKLFVHHKQIHESLESEELQSPSTGFTNRVMETIYHIQANRVKFFNRSRLIVIGLIGLILLTTAYYLSMKFYPTLGGTLASELTVRQFTFDLNPTRNFLDSDSLFKIVFYVNGAVCLLLLDRAVLKPFFARRRERYSM